MELDAHIALIASWLDVVHVESAAARVSEAHDRHHSAERDVITPASSSVDLYRTALHEAAHAVVAFKSCIVVSRVRVRAGGAGSTAFVELPDDNPIGVVTTHLAGIAMELLAGADEFRRFALAHSSDLLSARLAIDDYPCPTSARTFAVIAVCTVREQCEVIVRVAQALRALGELDGPTIAALCGRAQ